MVSKKNTLIIVLITAIIASVTTFSIGNVVQLKLGDKVIVKKTDYEKMNKLYKKYSKNEYLESMIEGVYLNDITEQEILEGQYKGMFESLNDPYSVYMTKDEYASFMEDTRGTYGGIGVIVSPAEDGLITVVAPIEDTPGERAGLKTGDKIIKIEGEEFFGSNMDEAIKVMKGTPGTDVLITIKRQNKDGEVEIFDVSITREEIRLKSVKSDVIEGNIGYIRIIQFDELAYDDFKVHLTELQKKDIKGLIIDLRSNPGGLMDECAQITDELIGKSTIVYTETKNGEREYLRSGESKINIPYAILVNGGSASASEILTGAVQDTDSGEIIGTTTFGKGIVQRIKDLADGSGFKITVSKYFTPNGTSIHGIGIEPDIVLELNEEAEGIGVDYIDQDNQLQKAVEVIKEKIK